MKKSIYIAGLLPFLFAACEDVNDKIEGLDEIVENNKLVVDNSIKYTLTDADYVTIGGYTAVDDADAVELKNLASGNVQAFSSSAFAHKYIPNLLASKYFQLDPTSSAKVTYNVTSAADETYTALLAAQTVELTAEDYTKAGSKVEYLTPSTESKVASLLSSKVASPVAGDYCVVSYDYSSSEPSTSGDDEADLVHWTPIEFSGLPSGSGSYWDFTKIKTTLSEEYAGQKIRIGARYVSTTALAGTVELANLRIDDGAYIRPTVYAYHSSSKTYRVSSSKISAGEIVILANYNDKNYVLDKISDSKGKGYGYSDGSTVTVTDGAISEADFNANKLTLEAVTGGFTVKNTDGKYLGCTGYNSFQYVDAIPADTTGYVWSFANIGGTITMTNVAKEYKVTFSTSYSTFGQYPDSKVTSYYENSLCGSSLPDGYFTKDVSLTGSLTKVWTPGSYYVKASGYASSANNASESWLISPEIDLSAVTSSASISLDMAARFFSGNPISDCFQIYVSTDYADDAEFSVADNKSLKATSTSEKKYALYTYDGSSWSEATEATVVSPSDYSAMGMSYSNFSKSQPAGSYLPKFLASKFPYAQDDDVVYVAYNYYDGSTTTLSADKYVYSDGAWSKVSPNAKTEQYVYSSTGWVCDPCVTITLPNVRNNATSVAFYQAVVDWVWENIDKPLGSTSIKDGKGYTTKYGNNEYYTGCSAYYSNVDWRAAKAIEKYADGYAGLSDDEVFAKMQEHFIDVVGKVLGTLYPDAEVVDGIDAIYTINFTAYYAVDGANTSVGYSIKYKVVGKATFEYVEDSLQKTE